MSISHSTIMRIMETSNVMFGTSGARGLVKDMTDRVCYAYTVGFLQYMRSIGDLPASGGSVAVAGDLRTSSGRIMAAVFKAVQDSGHYAVNCGRVPSPAVALYGLVSKIPTVMVTGSHIPDDRNGIKFNKADGEILKDDEIILKQQEIQIDDSLFDGQGMLHASSAPESIPVNLAARNLYLQRYTGFYGRDFLKGKKVGFYQHSAVGRDMLPALLEDMGAEVVRFGISESFVPVDTEAIRPEDVKLAREMVKKHGLDAIYSTDGDSDRPLVADEKGNWFRGDVSGILASQHLGADSVSTPVSCNTALEKCGCFNNIRRTRIGSPYVVAAMQEAVSEGYKAVTGYEANGGFLTGTDILKNGAVLPALPTRDTAVVFLSLMGLSLEQKKPLSGLLAGLPSRYTASGRLKEFPTEKSSQLIARFYSGDFAKDAITIEKAFDGQFGTVVSLDSTDGLRVVFDNGEIVHLRPSGNAPEFRCYNEADSESRVARMNAMCLRRMETWR